MVKWVCTIPTHTLTTSNDKITFSFLFDREIMKIEEKSASNFAPIHLVFQRPLNICVRVCERLCRYFESSSSCVIKGKCRLPCKLKKNIFLLDAPWTTEYYTVYQFLSRIPCRHIQIPADRHDKCLQDVEKEGKEKEENVIRCFWLDMSLKYNQVLLIIILMISLCTCHLKEFINNFRMLLILSNMEYIHKYHFLTYLCN